MMPRDRTKLKIIAAMLGIFVLGCVTGAALSTLYQLRAQGTDQPPYGRGAPGDKREAFFEQLRRDLNLTEEQAAQIRQILDQTRDEFRRLRAEVRPRYDAIRQNADARIRAVLTPEQRARFDAIVAQKEAERNEAEKRER